MPHSDDALVQLVLHVFRPAKHLGGRSGKPGKAEVALARFFRRLREHDRRQAAHRGRQARLTTRVSHH